MSERFESTRWSTGLSRHRIVAHALALLVLSLLARSAAAQGASLEYRVAFNGALGGPIIVTDNGPGDTNLAPGNVTTNFTSTNGVMTVSGTIIGQKIPGANGRQIIVTAVDGHVLPGQFQSPAGIIDIYACYKFLGPGFQVGPPFFFRRACVGSFVNAVDGIIDLALIRFNAAPNSACAIGPGDPGAFVAQVGPLAAAPIPFFHAPPAIFSPGTAVDIGTITRLVLANNGDGVSLPGSIEASVLDPTGGSDDCATPNPITGIGPFDFDNTTATTGAEGQSESLCNYFGSTAILNDVWFAWTAPSTGQALLTTCGYTTVDTKIAVYDGGACPASSALACNDDNCSGAYQSTLTFPIVAGNTYAIQLGDYPGSSPPATPGTGQFTINFGSVPPNDDCTSATSISGPGRFFYDTTFASTGSQGQTENNCNLFGTPAIDDDVWFHWVAPFTGSASFDSCISGNLDSKIAVYSGSGCPSPGSSIGCDDDGCGPVAGGSRVIVSVFSGQSYTIQIGQYPGAPGGSSFFEIANTAGPFDPSVLYCFGDGSGTACTCQGLGPPNPSAPGAMEGCANSVTPGVGGKLRASAPTSAIASVAADAGGANPITLYASQMPNSSCLYFQGTLRQSGGAGTAFGDGLRCAGGSVVRLATKFNSAGASQYPNVGDLPLSTKGMVSTSIGLRTYQAWYRNAALFCVPNATFNLTNGAEISWVP